MSVLKKDNEWVKRVVRKTKKNHRVKKQHSRYMQLFQKNKRMKHAIIAICSSLMIGITFGLLFLSMVKQEEGQLVDILHSSTTDVSEGEREEHPLSLEPLQFFVVQAGVFTNEQNAKNFSKTFSDLSYPFFLWERDGQYFVFTGIAATEKKANNRAEKMDEHDLEVYVKHWEIDRNNELSKEDQKFIETFFQLWEQSLTNVDRDEKVAMNEWNDFIKMNDVSENIAPLKENIEQTIEENDKDEQQLLLQLMYEYEKFFYSE